MGITLDKTSTIEISEDQFQTCQKANRQYFILNTPLLPLANSSTHVSALYAKDKDSIQKTCSLQVKKVSSISLPTFIAPNARIITSYPAAVPARITLICPGEALKTITPQTPIHILQLQPACIVTSQQFHLPPHYESLGVTTNISLNTANLNAVNISAPEVRIWQHLEGHWNGTLLQHLVNMPSVTNWQAWQEMITSDRPMNPFLSADESMGETVSVWTLFSHAGLYVMAIGSLHTSRIRDIFCYFFWCQPARLGHQPLQSGSTWYTIVDDNAEASAHLQMQWQRLDSL